MELGIDVGEGRGEGPELSCCCCCCCCVFIGFIYVMNGFIPVFAFLLGDELRE